MALTTRLNANSWPRRWQIFRASAIQLADMITEMMRPDLTLAAAVRLDQLPANRENRQCKLYLRLKCWHGTDATLQIFGGMD